MEEINFKVIEEKWQKKWDKEKVFVANDKSKKTKHYVLEMFPYPSGEGLHMGHAWNYTIGDIIARFKRMRGFEVLHPIGFDALGLPAENAAIQDGTHPEEYTQRSIKNFIRQLKELGLSYDWARQINSALPEYYKWDQWIFLKMLEKGLAYQKESNVNWCPSCNTVLANEQAQNGKCDRCDSKVEVKHLKQWFLKITNYADELYGGLDNLKEWPEKTRLMQKHWIGKSYGVEVDFEIASKGVPPKEKKEGKKYPVFTTRPDTIFGVTFMVISVQHKKLETLVTKEQKKEVEKFLERLKSVSNKDLIDLEKEGVFTGSYAINPANGEKVPIYAGDFVVADYGSGMVMAVPAHDKRDFEFAKKYAVPIKLVINPENFEIDEKNIPEAYTEKGILINSEKFDGLKNDKAKEEITKWLEKKEAGRKTINFRLRDWGISRQRYWGTPIPIIYCEDCGAVPVLEKDLPVVLPKEVKFGEGNPLETNEKWIKAKCPCCGKTGRRETDTMDTFVNSSWYFMRYCDSKNDKEIFDKKKVKMWCPVDNYIGGAEHSCMHLIYSRFYIKFLRDLGLLEFDEPAKRLFHQGMLHGEDGNKMSKSKGNGVLPEEVSDKFGIDTARFFLSSLASPDKDIEWSEKGIIGSSRFMKKIFDFVKGFKSKEDTPELTIKLNNAIKNVTEYYGDFMYRKATIDLRALFDLMENGCSKETLEKFLKMLNPICPHITEELWEKLGNVDFISISEWPGFDSKKLKLEKKEIDLNEKLSIEIGEVVKKLEEKGTKIKKIYLYVIPFELSKIDVKKLGKALKKEVEIYSVKDEKKHDPQGKAKKAKPGMPGVWFE